MKSYVEDKHSSSHIGVIVVDVQADFTTWKNGPLAVNGSDKGFVERIQKATEALKEKGYRIYATMDWHPKDHISFFTNHNGKKVLDTVSIDGRTQVLWPPHCIQNTAGADLLPDENLFDAIVKKGKNNRFDSYSGFRDDGGAPTEMNDILKNDGVTDLIIYGIALDYCVKATAIDAALEGYKVTVVEDLTAGISPESSDTAKKEMLKNGVMIKKRV